MNEKNTFKIQDELDNLYQQLDLAFIKMKALKEWGQIDIDLEVEYDNLMDKIEEIESKYQITSNLYKYETIENELSNFSGDSEKDTEIEIKIEKEEPKSIDSLVFEFKIENF